MNDKVTGFIKEAPHQQSAILKTIRALIHEAVPGVTEEFKWSRPVYRSNKDFAYLKTSKDYVTLGFYDASQLYDPNGRLEGTGKQMRHIKLRKPEDLDPGELRNWLREAAGLADQEAK